MASKRERERRRVARYKGKTPSKKIKWQPILVIMVIVGIWYAFLGRHLWTNFKSPVQVLLPQEKNYETACTQANVAKIVAYNLMSTSPEKKQDELWYEKYYDILVQKGIKCFNKEEALQPVTYEFMTKLFNELAGEGYTIRLGEGKDPNETISLKQFINSYAKILGQVGKEMTLNTEELAILATPADGNDVAAWQVITDQGIYGFEGLVLEPFKSETVTVLEKNNEILGITNVVSETTQLEDCLIKEVKDQEAVIEVGGFNLTYSQKDLGEQLVGSRCNITLKGNAIVKLEVTVDSDTDEVTRVTDDSIELAKAGRLQYSEVTMEDVTGKTNYTSLKQLPYGTQVKCEVANGELVHLQVVGEAQTGNNIRVLLSNKEKYVQNQIQLISTEDYKVVYNGETTSLPAQTSWKSDEFEWVGGVNTIRFYPITDSFMKVMSSTKSEGNPKYKGMLEVTKQEDGFILINELDLENYVAGVIPSEMPTSYGLEALKVQAIAARTYATNSKKSNKYIAYSAQIDDTVASQVYNNTPADELAYEAAEATKNQILNSESGEINSKFFATSCGYTANSSEVWSVDDSFSGTTPEYLSSEKQYLKDEGITDMTDEAQAAKFFSLSGKELEAFDQDSPWFRWTVHLSETELENLINPALASISEDYPNLVKTQDTEGNWVSGSITSVGTINGLEILERGQGGNIMSLLIDGTKAKVKVSTEYLIRKLFSTNSSQALNVLRSNGSQVNGMSMLPSAFFSLTETQDAGHLSQITLQGGGFGHGVGMSQDGVLGMVEKGYDYRTIIEHFYPGTEMVDYSH